MRRDGGPVPKQVLQRRYLSPLRMTSLQRLVELLWIAKEDSVAGGLSHGQYVGERHLTSLVHEEYVDGLMQLFTRPEPRRASCDLSVVRLQHGNDVLVLCGLENRLPLILGRLAAHFLYATDREPFPGRRFDNTLEQVPDDLVTDRGNADLFSGPHEITDHPRAGIGLSGTWGGLDGEHTTVELERQPASRGRNLFTLLLER